jgi:hypothetical protein
MSEELTTDKIYEKITTIALDKEKKRCESVLWKAHADIGLGGSCAKVYVKPEHDENGLYVFSTVFIEALITEIMNNRKGSIERDAVFDFLKSVETFKQQMSALEQYSLERE